MGPIIENKHICRLLFSGFGQKLIFFQRTKAKFFPFLISQFNDSFGRNISRKTQDCRFRKKEEMV